MPFPRCVAVAFLVVLSLRPALARKTSADSPAPPAVDVREAVARAIAATVTIEGDGMYGAGILVLPREGLVLTAHHVIEEMRAPEVVFSDGKRLAAKVREFDRALDVALLEIPPQERVAPTLGDATALQPGEEVYAVGCPRRLAFSVSRGIVSFVGRSMDGARYIQSDLPINDGNSGGPVVNARGEVVGMMSFILKRAQGISFALPVNYAAERFQRLAKLVTDPKYFERFRRWLSDAH